VGGERGDGSGAGVGYSIWEAAAGHGPLGFVVWSLPGFNHLLALWCSGGVPAKLA
jgi:hypothetical protein